ncbi:DUF4200 domain-containing protein [Saccharomonospora sp. NB11]|jgi:hypothetical protein|uniref:DUF4200 domain-containing protein n=1 Tax=Saccharomonospora sp. NB11 TaxID=1642298 RepID=UPI0018D19FCC|nr:DUF4200 domain-containing protein [Saccharomonospora sp. NB11]
MSKAFTPLPTPGPVSAPARSKPRRWPWLTGCAAAFLLGLAVGAVGDSKATKVVTEQVEVPGEIPGEQREALQQREAELDERNIELDERSTELDAREAALQKEEQEVAANTIGEGVWTVGVDIEPGTYRATDVSSMCYWEIRQTGVTGFEGVINNGLPGGGNPSVTLSEGQDFQTNRCGEWTKQ